MKQILYILAIMFLTFSCGGTQVEPPQIIPLDLYVDKTELVFTAAGGSLEFTVQAQENPSMSPWDKWYTVKKGTWDESKHSVDVTVTADPNTAQEERTSRISVVCGDQKAYVEIRQAAAEGGQGGTPTDPAPTPDGGAAWSTAAKLGIGWNMGNHFDAHSNGVSSETAWGNPEATQKLFTKVKAAGFSTVRIPVTWLGHIGETPDYKIDEAWLDRVAEVVGYAENVGLNVILNMHHDGADSKYWLNIKSAAQNPKVHEQILDQIEAMWSQIAWKFQDKGDFLIFEAFNEIHDGGWGWGDNRNDGGKQYQCLNEWNQMFVSTVRGAGSQNNMERMLGIAVYSANPDLAIESLEMPVDYLEDRLMVSVHCYDPYDYALAAKKSEWGHTASSSKKVAGDNEGDLKAVFVKLYEKFIANDIPVYLGEFGCVNRATAREQAFQQYYLKYFAKLSKTYGIPCILWDNGAAGHGEERHAFINHGTGEYCSEEAKAAVKALVDSYNNDLTLEQIYNGAPK